jgi:hypothetical protein
MSFVHCTQVPAEQYFLSRVVVPPVSLSYTTGGHMFAVTPFAAVEPHPPQLFTSLLVSTHFPLQNVVPEGHWHLLLTHDMPEGHALLHPPQLFVSVKVFTHCSGV